MKMFQSWLFTDFCSNFTCPTLWQTGWRAFTPDAPGLLLSSLLYLYAQMIAKLFAMGAALWHLRTILLLSSDTSLNTVPWRTILWPGVNHPFFFFFLKIFKRWLEQKRCALISGNSQLSSLLQLCLPTVNYALSPRLLLCALVVLTSTPFLWKCFIPVVRNLFLLSPLSVCMGHFLLKQNKTKKGLVKVCSKVAGTPLNDFHDM